MFEVSSTNNSYNPAKSNTSVVTTTKWAIQYGSGNASGTVCRDVANIAGIKISNLTFGQATQIDSNFRFFIYCLLSNLSKRYLY